MVEPVTIAGLGVWGLGAVFGGVLGNKSDKIVDHLSREVGQRFAGFIGLPANHDAAKALRKAQMEALQFISAGDQLDDLPDYASDGPRTHMFAKALKRHVAAEHQWCVEASIDEAAASAFVDAINAALTEPVDLAGGVRHDIARDRIEQITLDEIAATTTYDPPPGFIARFRGEHDGYIGWFDAFARYLAEEIKNYPKFRDILTATKLASLEELGLSAAVLLERIDQRGEEIAAQMDRIEAKLDRVGTDVAEILGLLKAQGGIARAEEAGLNEAQITTVLEAFGAAGLPINQAESFLLQSAEQLGQLESRLRRLSNDDPSVKRLRGEAAEKIDAGAFDDADDLLSRAEQIDLEAIDEFEQMVEQRRLSAAESMAERGDLAMSQFLHLDAANHFRRAADTLPNNALDARWHYLVRLADALYEHGSLCTCNTLELAAEVLGNEALPLSNEGHGDGFVTVTKLAATIKLIGQRRGGEEGRGMLGVAVDMFSDVLTQIDEDEAPHEWARTQNNLGAALQVLSSYSDADECRDRLEQAIEAFTAALRVHTEQDHPFNWAFDQNNLGAAYQALGLRLHGDERRETLDRSIEAFTAALRARTKESMPLEWATTQHSLGLALQAHSDTAPPEERGRYLQQAVTAFETACQVFSPDATPLDWARVQSSLSSALAGLSELTGGEEGLRIVQRAVDTAEEALCILPEDTVPFEWAEAQHNLCTALYIFVALTNDDDSNAHLARAVAAGEAAIAVRTKSVAPLKRQQTMQILGLVHTSSGLATYDDDRDSAYAHMKRAVGLLTEVLEAAGDVPVSAANAAVRMNLGLAQGAVAEANEDIAGFRQAHEDLKAVREDLIALKLTPTVEQIGAFIAAFEEEIAELEA